MKELIELLNHTSPARCFFYGAVFLIALAIIVDGIATIVGYLFGDE